MFLATIRHNIPGRPRIILRHLTVMRRRKVWERSVVRQWFGLAPTSPTWAKL